MQAISRAMGALAALAAPLSAQSAEAPEASTAEVEQAIHCAAVQTFIAALVAESDNPDRDLEDRLQRSTVRWLEHASTLPPKDEQQVMDRYKAQSEALLAPLETDGFDASAYGEQLGEDALACVAAERTIFGNTLKDL